VIRLERRGAVAFIGMSYVMGIAVHTPKRKKMVRARLPSIGNRLIQF
jgi:hypothetical protein